MNRQYLLEFNNRKTSESVVLITESVQRFHYYLATNGKSAIVRARLIAFVSLR